jgi:hypothetical protein
VREINFAYLFMLMVSSIELLKPRTVCIKTSYVLLSLASLLSSAAVGAAYHLLLNLLVSLLLPYLFTRLG